MLLLFFFSSCLLFNFSSTFLFFFFSRAGLNQDEMSIVPGTHCLPIDPIRFREAATVIMEHLDRVGEIEERATQILEKAAKYAWLMLYFYCAALFQFASVFYIYLPHHRHI
jgi:hypothetical protein